MGKKSVTWEKKKKRLKTAREGDIAIAVLCLIFCVVWVGLSQLIYLAEADGITEYFAGTSENSKEGLFVGALGGVPLFLLTVFFGVRGISDRVMQKLIVRFGQETKCRITKPGNRMKRYFWGYKEKQFYFEVSYQGKNGPAMWRSSFYTENPMEYIKQGSVYPFYVWGKLCCMGPLEKEETVCERMPAMRGKDVEIRFQANRVLGSETGHRLGSDLLEYLEGMREKYKESERDLAAEEIIRAMEAAAQERLGRIPVTEVLVYLS